MAPVTDHIEGQFFDQIKELKLDPKTGDSATYVRKGQRESYYIPFTKNEVEKVIEQYKANPQLINFVVKYAPEDSPDGQRRSDSRGQFGYDQFATWTFDELYRLHIKPWKDMDPNYAPTSRMYK